MKRSLFLAGATVVLLAGCNPAQQNAANNAAEAPLNGVAAAEGGGSSVASGTEEGAPTQIASGATAGEQAPPPIPDYPQPPAPAPDYIWTPGYWAWNASESNYYWAPGTWARPPRPNLLWTPGYWALVNGIYAFTGGHWGSRVGFYGGVNYGYGYGGAGYQGGEWRGDHFYYNTAVTNAPAGVANVYQRPVPQAPPNHASFVGGAGGLNARPTPQEAAESRAPHVPPTREQAQVEHQAVAEPRLRADSVVAGRGAPAVAEIQRRQPAPAARPMTEPARPEARPQAEPARAAERRPEARAAPRPAAEAPRKPEDRQPEPR
jgi:hypothetical protein